MNSMHQYHDLMSTILNDGYEQSNRTTERAITLPYGSVMRFDMQEGYPAVTTKKLYFDGVKGEVIGFLRGLENSEDFKKLGCKWWDKDANENTQWLASPHRKGPGDLGKVYGSQWRRWKGDVIRADPEFTHRSSESLHGTVSLEYSYIDQVQVALDLIRNNPENRRIIINTWRPDQFDQMALPPCHVLYRFQVDTKRRELHMSMYQRSSDMFLGVPMNIAGSALMLHLFAAATGLTPRWFTHHMDDTHIYLNSVDSVKTQLTRTHYMQPGLVITKDLFGASADEMASIDPEEISLKNYFSHPPIYVPMVTG